MKKKFQMQLKIYLQAKQVFQMIFSIIKKIVDACWANLTEIMHECLKNNLFLDTLKIAELI